MMITLLLLALLPTFMQNKKRRMCNPTDWIPYVYAVTNLIKPTFAVREFSGEHPRLRLLRAEGIVGKPNKFKVKNLPRR